MKSIVRRLVVISLAFLAHFVVRKYHPKVVMVTGSVGKTSTKDALAVALKSRFYVRAPEKSHNSEFGVPFTIFGVKNPWKNVGRWLNVYKEAIILILLPNHYPNLLVLEVGADRPGDIRRILEIVTPDALVVTRLPDVPVHVEAYATPEAVREEEFSPAYTLPPGAPLIVAADDNHALKMAGRVPAEIVTYGLPGEIVEKPTVEVGKSTFYTEEGKVAGMKASVVTSQGEGEIVIKGSVGCQQVLPAAAALACALKLGVPFGEALEAVNKYEPPPGRGRIFAGVNGSVLIDDSYNSSPAALEEALKTLKSFPKPRGGKRIAVLGDMLELGRYSVNEHQRLGAFAEEVADLVVSVGIRARAFGGARAYDDAATAAKELAQDIKAGDIILVKGSQSVRTERVVEALLANPVDASRLVRQEKEWKKL